MLDFEISGAATLLGVGNGNPTSHEPEQAPHRQLFNGYAQLIIRIHGQPGTVSIHAHADQLESGKLRIETPNAITVTPSIGASTVQTSDVKKLNPIDGSL
jgi:beta-galactosidase